ncbi:barstar family protein [Catellatospora tritici]|uniref:barstar family protein n=1 Tax=Catellatospora tritici TaxID=2851566 RepID=UPI001C2DED31|nr:barstar family protein [Catellatospora tritici]
MAIRNPYGGVRQLDGFRPEMRDIVGWVDTDRGLLWLAATCCAAVAVLDLTVDEIVTSVDLAREPDSGLCHIRFAEAPDEALVCAYEHGVVVFEQDGRLRWSREHADLSLRLERIDAETVWLEHQLPHPRRRGIGMRLADGVEVPWPAAATRRRPPAEVRRVVLDGRLIATEAEFHRRLARELDFGPYYGANLSALWDRLTTDVAGPVELVWTAADHSRAAMGADAFDRIRDVLVHVAQDGLSRKRPDAFTVCFE